MKTTVGNYKIVREVGVGGMGAVFEAVDLMLERPVAIKMLRAEIARQPELIERFRVEAVTLARLNHPAIATLFSFFREGQDYYMVMEFVRGRTLEAMLTETPRLPPENAVDVLGQALEGMSHAHALGVLHRDIKPANIMIAAGGAVKVTDFGIARILGSSRMTREGRIIGTLEYIAPERIKGEEADIRSDVYSAGVVLFEALAGRLPFVADTDFGMIEAHLHQSPPRLAELGVSCPASLDAVLRKALEKPPAKRFQSADEFRNALTAAVPSRGIRPLSAAAAAPMKPTRLAGGAPLLRETRLAGEEPLLRETRLAGEKPAESPAGKLPKLSLPLLGAASVALLVLAVGMSLLARRHLTPPAPDAPVRAAVSTPLPALPPPPVVEEEAVPPPTPPPLQGTLPGAVPGAAPGSPAADVASAGGGRPVDLGQAAAAPSAQSTAGPRSIRGVRTLFIEAMPNHLDAYIRADIAKEMPTRLTVVSRREDADAVMTGTSQKHGGSGSRLTNGYLGVKDEFSGTVTITDPGGGRVLWTSEAGDKAVLIGILKRNGPKRVAERLVGKLRKAMERK
jgi:serine/threonine-protein kinase